MTCRPVLLTLAAVLAAPFGPAAAQDATAPHGEVRTLTPDLRQALQAGLERSATFRHLVEEIEDRDGLIVLESESRLLLMRAGIFGATSHDVVAVGARRLVRITIVPRDEDRTIATLAHELQHAAEILRSDARNRSEVTALYERIGYSSKPEVFETDAAREVTRRVMRELAIEAAQRDTHR